MRESSRYLLWVTFITLVYSYPSSANEDFYSVFHPKPSGQVRSLNTDRPTRAPTPYTIDAGHFLMEMDVINYTASTWASDPSKQETANFIISTFKMGILDDLEIQFSPPTYSILNSSTFGWGDFFIRTKFNIAGNRGELTALAFMPYVKIPSGSSSLSNRAFEGGLILPGAVSLSNKWSLGYMLEIDFKANATDSGSHQEGQSSVYLSHSWLDALSSYLEFYTQKSFQASSFWVFTVNVGALYKITPDIQFDVGSNFSLNSAAPAFNPFLGFSFRL